MSQGSTEQLRGRDYVLGLLWRALSRAASAQRSALTSVVLRPGDTSGAPGVFTSWAALYAACSSIPGGVRVFVDDSIVSPVHMTAGGPFNLNGWRFSGAASFTDAEGTAALVIDDGVTWDGSKSATLTIESLDVSSAAPANVCTIAAGAEFNLTLFGTRIVMTGAGALFDVTTTGLGGFLLATLQLSNLGDGTHAVVNAGSTPDFCTIDSFVGSFVETGSVTGCIFAFDSSAGGGLIPGASYTFVQRDHAEFMAYNASVPANWSGTSPASVANALDRIAAKITPIP
jgi:hypothetical protein